MSKQLSTLEKAKKQLENIDVFTRIENDSLYVCIGDILLELSEFEVEFRAKLYSDG